MSESEERKMKLFLTFASVFLLQTIGGNAGVVSSTTTTSSSSPPKTTSTTSLPKTSVNGSVSQSTIAATTSTTPSPTTVTELPEELTTIIEIDEAEGGNSSESVDFVNLPGYGVVDDANTTVNSSVFSCYNRRYGYYADIAKNCYMFHLCYPVQEPTSGQLIFQRFSFVCSDNAVFDQQHLVCVDNETLPYPCSESHKFFIESNNKLIESMQQGYMQGQHQHHQQHSPQTGHPIQSHISSGQALPIGADGTIALESSDFSSNATSEADVEEDAAAQYALLEQLFG